MIKIVISKKAENDLSAIVSYITLDNVARAHSYIEELLQSVSLQLSQFPLSCPLHNKVKNIRKFVYEKYNVYYRYDTTSKYSKNPTCFKFIPLIEFIAERIVIIKPSLKS